MRRNRGTTFPQVLQPFLSIRVSSNNDEEFYLIDQYFRIIIAKRDFALCASSLTAIAPALLDEGLHLLEGMLVARQTQYMTSTAAKSLAVYEMFQIYDDRLGARQNPDPNSFAILLLLSKSTPSYEMKDVDNFSLKLNNPWLRLAARVVARLDTPDEPGLDIRSFHGNRDHNIMAALSLPRYTEGEVTQFTESVFLASFLESREFVISSLALEYYIRTAISYVDLPAPSCYLSGAICAIFNVVLHDHRLRMGWTILEIFVDGFENLSGEWRQTFAEAFFSLSRQPLPRSQGSMVTTTPDLELEEILTWEYFHKEEQEYQFTDLDFTVVVRSLADVPSLAEPAIPVHCK